MSKVNEYFKDEDYENDNQEKEIIVDAIHEHKINYFIIGNIIFW